MSVHLSVQNVYLIGLVQYCSKCSHGSDAAVLGCIPFSNPLLFDVCSLNAKLNLQSMSACTDSGATHCNRPLEDVPHKPGLHLVFEG